MLYTSITSRGVIKYPLAAAVVAVAAAAAAATVVEAKQSRGSSNSRPNWGSQQDERKTKKFPSCVQMQCVAKQLQIIQEKLPVFLQINVTTSHSLSSVKQERC